MENKIFDVFLSYARSDDQKTVEKVYKKLTESGLRVWWDKIEMTQRELSFTEEIGRIIKSTPRLVLFAGENMPNSEYVDSEWRYARKCGVKVYPVVYSCNKDDPDRYTLVPKRLRKMHVRDLSGAVYIDTEIEKLIIDLREELSPLAPLLNVPSLPAGYVEREELLDTLVDYYFNDSSKNIGEVRFCSIWGMGGSGKSTIASALCHDETVRRQFEEIIWVRLSDKSDLSDAWKQLASQCSLPLDLDELDARIALSRKYEHKTCLFVFDNCESQKIVEFLSNALDTSRNRVLLTSRSSTLNSTFGIQSYAVPNKLTGEEPLKLLAGYCHLPVKELGDDAKQFIEAVGGHALALAVGAAMFLEIGSWEVITESYFAAEAEFDFSLPNYEYKNVMISIDASVKKLEPELCTLFMMLAVFKRDISIPLKQLTMLWEDKLKTLYNISGKADMKVFFLLKKLHSRSLLTYDGDNKCVTLHNLVCDYLAQKQDVAAIVPSFIEKIGQCKDEYYYEYILYHMMSIGEKHNAHELLMSYDYQVEKMRINGINSLIRDFSEFVTDESRKMQMFYKLSAHIIKTDPNQITAQLFGRFKYPNDNTSIHTLMTAAKDSVQPPYLCPVGVCMMPPGTAQTDIIRMSSTVFSLRRFGGKLLVSDKSGTATVLDPESCDEEKIIRTPAWCIDSFISCECIVSIYDKKKIRIYDQRSESFGDFAFDGLISSHTEANGKFYIGDTTGCITAFKGNKRESSVKCPNGISCLYTEEDGSITVYCINKDIYSLGSEFKKIGSFEDRIIKRQGNIMLSSHGKLYISGRAVSGTGYVKDFDEDIYINNKDKIVVFDTSDGRALNAYKSSSELRTVCKIGNFVFTGSNAQNIHKWDLRLPRPEVDESKQWINSMASHSDDLYYVRQNGSIYKNGLLTAQKDQWYNAMAVTDRYIITADNVGGISLFNKDTLENEHQLSHGQKITDMAFLSTRLFVADGLGNVSVWDLEDLSETATHKIGSWITSVTLIGTDLACSDRYGHIMFYDSQTMTYQKTVDLQAEIACITNHCGYLAVALKSNVIKLIDPNSGSEICTYYPSFSNITHLYSHKDILYVCTEVNMQKVQLIESSDKL